MKTRRSRRKTETWRRAVLWCTLGGALVWGLVELLALQRSRYQQVWRDRHHAPAARLQR